jgi:hypothetical protein
LLKNDVVMNLENRLSSSVVVVASRRRAPRVAAGDQLQVDVVSVLVPAEVLDLSVGGFSIETRCSLRVGATHHFRFLTAAGRTVVLKAKVVHCRRKATADWSERYVTGCEFLYDPAINTDELIDELIDAATGVLSIE